MTDKITVYEDGIAVGRRVVSFELSEHKTGLMVRECCDLYFEEELTKDEALVLLRELTALVERMKP